MFVYSNKIASFIKEIKSVAKEVISKKCCLRVTAERFYNFDQTCSYPLKVVIYNNKSMLGYFDPEFYELGFHECLMLTSKTQLHNIIRHEIAHYMTFITYGSSVFAHGAQFKEFCLGKGWGEDVYKATTCWDDGQNVSNIEVNTVLRKVQKLMALSSSSNQHEAELAMIKSQQLLLKHNVDSKYVANDGDEKIYLKRIMRQKKENAKMRAVARILETFFVNVVFSRAGGDIYLEILGTAVNIEIAEYVAEILDRELDNLWNQAQRYANLKGMIAKNSFFLGIAKGYCNKIDFLKREYSSDVANALMVIEKQLVDAKAMVYSRLTTSKSKANHCRQSASLGEIMGRQLNINPAIEKSSKNSPLLIG